MNRLPLLLPIFTLMYQFPHTMLKYLLFLCLAGVQAAFAQSDSLHRQQAREWALQSLPSGYAVRVAFAFTEENACGKRQIKPMLLYKGIRYWLAARRYDGSHLGIVIYNGKFQVVYKIRRIEPSEVLPNTFQGDSFPGVYFAPNATAWYYIVSSHHNQHEAFCGQCPFPGALVLGVPAGY